MPAKGWSDSARKASAENRRGGSPTFVDFSSKHLGPNWTLARPTAKAKERYENATFVKPSQYEAVAKKYAKEHPDAAGAHFGQLYLDRLNKPKAHR